LKKRKRGRIKSIIKILADGGYSGENMTNWVKDVCNVLFEIVKRTELHTFVVLPKRWIVERTFGWIG
jgi:transposase